MYVLEDDCKERIAWYKASGDSIFEIAILFQKGLIKRSHIKAHKGDHSLLVKLNNFNYINCDTPVQLYIIPIENSVPVIKLVFGPDDYVAQHYRPDIKTKVNESTWIDLLEINESEYYTLPTKQKHSIQYNNNHNNDIDIHDDNVKLDPDEKWDDDY